MQPTAETVKKRIDARVGFNSGDTIPMFITDVILPTVERREFTHASYSGQWHADRYVMRQDVNAMMIYFKKLDLWVVHTFHKLWGDCTEKKYVCSGNVQHMEQIAKRGYPALAQLRILGRLE